MQSCILLLDQLKDCSVVEKPR